jgi:hypothetical protein
MCLIESNRAANFSILPDVVSGALPTKAENRG